MRTELVRPTFTVEDGYGKIHEVLAVKPKTSHPDDAHLLVVIHKGHSGVTPFVVHDMNLSNGGFHIGFYCETFAEALRVFNER